MKSPAWKRLKDIVWRKLGERMHLDWRLPSGLIVSVRSYGDWCIYNEIFVNGEYDTAIQGALDAADRSRSIRVLDLGANLGYFALRFADLALRRNRSARMILVEGSPHAARELDRRMKPVRDAGMDCTVVPGLVGRKTGSASLNLGREGNVNSVGRHEDGVWQAVRGVVEVEYVDLDALIGDGGIDLLKCDIEGSEFEFLENYPALLQKTARLVVEFHATLGNIEKAKERLRAAGFNSLNELRNDALTSVCLATRQVGAPVA